MKIRNFILMALPIALALLASCKDSKSYSELLDDEEKSINSFLAHQKVLKQIMQPAEEMAQRLNQQFNDFLRTHPDKKQD